MEKYYKNLKNSERNIRRYRNRNITNRGFLLLFKIFKVEHKMYGKKSSFLRYKHSPTTAQ